MSNTVSMFFPAFSNKLDICMCRMHILVALFGYCVLLFCNALFIAPEQTNMYSCTFTKMLWLWLCAILFVYELLNHFWHRFPLESFILLFLAIPRFMRPFVYKRKLCTETDSLASTLVFSYVIACIL